MISPLTRGRISLIFCMLALWLFIIWVVCGIRQIWQGAWLSAYGKKQYAIEVTTLSVRAPIFDRRGVALAINSSSISAFVTPRSMHEPEAVATFLYEHFPAAAERLKHKRHTAFMYVKRGLTDDEQALINSSGLIDIYLLEEPARFYPIQAVAPLIGFTDRDNRGISGIELLYHVRLAGKPTRQIIERDARSRMCHFAEEMVDQGSLGESITLTIDAAMQQALYDELVAAVTEWNAADGAGIILDPDTGDLIAVAQHPVSDTDGQITCRPFCHAYEYGSVIKAFLALAALDSGQFRLDDMVDCENRKSSYVNGMLVTTVKPNGYISFAQVIGQSNNIGTSKVAQKLGRIVYDAYRRVGFGSRTGIHFPGEQSGFINPPHLWSKPSLNSLSFGYEIRVTLLQLACAFGALARDGVRVLPRLVITEQQEPPQGLSERICSSETAAQLKRLLQDTVEQGTASRAKIEGYTVMGKTGSALMLVDGHYDQARSIYTFVGIVERGAYRRVIAVSLRDVSRRGVYASTVAVPLFEKIAHRLLVRDNVIA